MFSRIKSDKRGFTLVELIATVAIIAVLVTIAIVGVLANSVKLKEKEYDQNAEAIAVAAQSRLTALKNAGDTDKLADLGLFQDDNPDQRYVSTKKADDINYILPPFSIDGSLREKDFVISFSATTAKVSEVFFFANGLDADLTNDSITALQDLRDNKKSDVGYYKAAVEEEVNVQPAGAQLPTPQLSINNFENLQLDIYLPYVRQLPDDLKLGFKVMLVGKDEPVPEENDESSKTIFETPVKNIDGAYSDITTGKTYSLILDTPQECLDGNDGNGNPTILNYNTDWSKSDNIAIPKGRFSTWARLTSSYIGDSDPIDSTLKHATSYDIINGFKLGEDVKAIVKVYAMKNGEQDKMYVTRTASVVFNGWFQSLTERTIKWDDDGNPKEKGLLADISCGRHLQNLSRLTEMRKNLQYLLPKRNAANNEYTYSLGNAYSYIRSTTYNYEKFARKYNVCSVVGAYQLMPIDFNTDYWYENSQPIYFDPINSTSGFYYYGNYYPIRNINVLSDYYAGLFGYSYKNKIYDVRLVNPTVKSNMTLEVSRDFEMGVGGLIGTDRDSSEINNCQVYLEKIDGNYDKNRRVEGNGYVGGLIGFAEDEDIRQCSASCFVGSTESHGYVGGLIGGVTGDSNIKRCYAAGILRGEYVGGILGAYMPDTDYSGDSLTIESCYTAGNIEAAVTSAGGLIGYTNKEQRGYEKSAMRAHKNYCVVIYGEEAANAEKSAGYVWRNNAKIYGTFDGDNFVWLYTGDDIVAEESIATDYYRILASAAYEEENYNYYVPQKGIEYAHSSLYMADGYVNGIQQFVTKYSNIKETFDVNTFSSDLKTQQDSVLKNNRLQVLEQIRQELISLYNDVNDYVDKGTLVNKLYNNEEIKIDYHFDHMPQGTNKDYDKDCLYVSSHSPRDKSKGDKIDTRRIVTIKDVIKSLIFGGAVPGVNESWSKTIENPANDTALWYIDQLEGLLKGTVTEVTIRTGATKAPQNKTYTLNGTGEGKEDDFKALIQKFASFFFSDKNSHYLVSEKETPYTDKKGHTVKKGDYIDEDGNYLGENDTKTTVYYWPNVGGSEERRGALSELFADIRGFFNAETYHMRSEIVYSYNDIYHSLKGSSHGAMHSGFDIDKDGNLIDIKRNNTIIAHNFDKSTSFSNGVTESSSNLLYDIIKNPDGSVAKKIALRDGYTLDSDNNLNYNKKVIVKNFDPTKNFDSSSNHYLLDENGSPVVKTEGDDDFYAMESFKDRVDKDILTMLYSLYHYGDSWQSGYIEKEMLSTFGKKGAYAGYAEDILEKYADSDYLRDIEGVTNIHSNTLNEDITGTKIKNLIKEIFGDEDSTGDLFTPIYDVLGKNKITLRDNFNNLIEKLNKLYKYFDKARDFYKEKVINADSASRMKKMRDYCSNLVSQIEKYSRMSYTGGIEEVLAKLSDAVELYENDSGKLKQEIDNYLSKVQIMLNTDSGHAIYDNETGVLNQLKALIENNSKTGYKGTFDYDDWYKFSYDGGTFDCNSGLYNTVFPYHEKGEAYTGVFPFPLIKGIKTQKVGDIGNSKVTEMLIHYGDWLTPDMWATEEYHRDEALVVLYDINSELQETERFLNEITSINNTSGTTGNFEKKEFPDFKSNYDTKIKEIGNKIELYDTENKQILIEIQTTIKDWVDDKGFITAFINNYENSNKETIVKVRKELIDLKAQLNDLLNKIDTLIGVTTNTVA